MEQTRKRKYPLGFFVCALGFTFERMAFYPAKWLIAVFVAAETINGGLGLTDVQGANMQAYLVAFTYLAPILGGYISDRYIGARYCVPVGMLLMAAGYFLGSQAHDATFVYLMIALVSVGTGLFKGNLSAINGRLFPDKEVLDSAFSLQYSFVNVGSLIGTLSIGVLVLATGFRFGFLVCAILMAVDAVWFLLGSRLLGEEGKKPFKYYRKEEELEEVQAVDNTPLSTIEKKRVAAIVLVSAFSVIFWLFWYLAYMPIIYYWPEHMDWTIGTFTVPTSWFDSLNALTCIALGPILGWLWSRLAKRPQGDLNMFKKTALGMIFLGLAYVIFSFADITRGGGMAHLAWIIAFGLILSLGEMVFSPLGNSFISKFAPPKLLSTMMSVWIFAIFIPGLTYGRVYAITKQFPFAASYLVIAAIILLCGAILWALNAKLNRLVIDEDTELENAKLENPGLENA